MKHRYYIKSITNWTSENQKEHKILMWFSYNRKIDFLFFDYLFELKNQVKIFKMLGLKKALKNYEEIGA